MKISPKAKTVITLLIAFALTFAPCTVFAAPQAPLTAEQLMQNPEAGITRGQFAMLLNAGLSLPEGAEESFIDVPEDHPYRSAIATAQSTGYMKGYGGGIFRPDAGISGAEAAVCLNYFLGFDLTKVNISDETTVPLWAKPAVSNLLDLQMLTLTLTDKKALTVADAVSFIGALTVAVMFDGSPYELTQANRNDDFFAWSNRGYLATATIPPGSILAMSFAEPGLKIQDQFAELLAGILAGNNEPGSDEWKIRELHRMYMDEPGRAASIEKVMPIIDEINAAQSIGDLNSVAAKYTGVIAMQAFYNIGANSDAIADATKWCVLVTPGGFMLGSRDYYADSPELTAVHGALKQYIASLLRYAGETENIESRSESVFAIEQSNALVSMPMEQLANPDVLYTKSSWAELDEAAAGSNSVNYSPELRDALKDANVYCPDMTYIKHIESLYTAENLQALKDFAIINTVGTFGSFLGDDLIELQKSLTTAMFGESGEDMSLERRAQTIITSLMSKTFSKLYAEEYVTAGIKTDVTEIVELIRDKYRDRINELSWMSAETKQKAVEKLEAITAYVAFPDEYGEEFNYEVTAADDGGNLVDFTITNSKLDYARVIDLLRQPFYINMWDSVPTFTVNAFYSRSENSIIIPAGILQDPLYSAEASREENLGAIGAIIAHEISHAFDYNGAKYDKTGTLTDWWTEEDYAAFNTMAENVTGALSSIAFVNDQTVNGALCVDETIADLGAMACIIDLADDEADADMAAVCTSWSGIWAARMSQEVALFMLSADSHLPNKLRTNFILSQLDAYYEAFDVAESDGMYIPPDDRIVIW